MPLRTRAFLYCFIPFLLLLGGSFWMIQRLVQSTVRDGLRLSLLENHEAVARVRSKSDLQSSRFLKVVGENASLKAGVQLLLAYPDNADARRTVEDQLRELCEHMGFQLMMITVPGGRPLAGVLRVDGVVKPLNTKEVRIDGSGLSLLNGLVYQIASVPIDQAEENICTLSVGEVFDFSEFTTPTVLFHDGQLLKSSIPGMGLPEVEDAMRHCRGTGECNVQLRGTNYISLPMQSISFGDGYLLRSLQNLDSAVGPVQTVLHNVFASVALGAVGIALIVSLASSGSIAGPIARVVERLRDAEKTGALAEFHDENSRVREIRGLIESFNRAAAAIREGRESLNLAYVEFVQSLASALDARDPYTAGHSRRVSEMASGVARAMGMTPDAVERVRVGALLHDIGKIGIEDSVLRKPGKLTAEEFATVSLHPEIGRRILEGVSGFSPFLAAVELHHENWDGTGYPHRQAGVATPADARIIHVADAYDAMTSDRPYRRGMTHETALEILTQYAGTQFDPDVVGHFTRLDFSAMKARERTFALAGASKC